METRRGNPESLLPPSEGEGESLYRLSRKDIIEIARRGITCGKNRFKAPKTEKKEKIFIIISEQAQTCKGVTKETGIRRIWSKQ